MNNTPPMSPLPLRRVFRAWWPLAASWMLMAAELPALSAVVARLANPEINLAAYGGVVFPLALIIEAPVIMLLAASTALSKDWLSYHKLRRFMLTAGVTLTALHVLVAFTPLYYWAVGKVIGAPAEIIEPARLGLMIMTPWTFAIGYRRFNQGVLIRFGHSQSVGIGTAIRLGANVSVLAIGYFIGDIPGILVAAGAVVTGVISEAIYVGVVVRPVVQNELKAAPPVKERLTLRSFLAFYVPLAMTSLLLLISQPMGSAALSRMPQALISLAVWPVVSGLVFMVRGLGIAYNEVVVALLDEPHSARNLYRFTVLLASVTTLLLGIIAATPLAGLWFQGVQGLKPELARLAAHGIWFALPMPALNVLQSWYQGAILHSRRTRGITEAMFVFLAVCIVILWAGVFWGRTAGLYTGLAAFVLAMLFQTAWLAYRSQPARRAVETRDADFRLIETTAD